MFNNGSKGGPGAVIATGFRPGAAEFIQIGPRPDLQRLT